MNEIIDNEWKNEILVLIAKSLEYNKSKFLDILGILREKSTAKLFEHKKNLHKIQI